MSIKAELGYKTVFQVLDMSQTFSPSNACFFRPSLSETTPTSQVSIRRQSVHHSDPGALHASSTLSLSPLQLHLRCEDLLSPWWLSSCDSLSLVLYLCFHLHCFQFPAGIQTDHRPHSETLKLKWYSKEKNKKGGGGTFLNLQVKKHLHMSDLRWFASGCPEENCGVLTT